MKQAIKYAKIGMPVLLVAFAAWLIWAPPARVGYAPDQPIAYSHELHAGQLQIDCQYCHSGVTTSKKAGVPSLNTCMNCHALGKVQKSSDEIKKIRTYFDKKKSPEWVRIHNMPDHVRFSHAPHIKALLKEGKPSKEACLPCHGDVAAMKVVSQEKPHNMGWCVNCHRDHRDDKEYKSHGVDISCSTCHY
jgi:ABC-type nickel/cobalt efflux system permease component RcnA